MDTITSLQNPRVKLVHGLQSRSRTRRKEMKVVLEGTRLIRDALTSRYRPEFVLFLPKAADYELVVQIQERNVELLPVTEEVMQHLTDTQQSQGMIAVFPLPLPELPRKPSRILILDAVADPGNMGTILRTAAAAGVEMVILAPDCVDPYNPKVLRAGMGAHFRVPLIEASWTRIAEYCEGMQILLATGESARPYTDVDWKQRWALVIGSEARGASVGALNTIQEKITIPMSATVESLNASIAAAVILFEAQRQRQPG